MELAKENNTFISLHEEDPDQMVFGSNENIAKKEFHICGGNRCSWVQYDCKGDVMIAYDTCSCSYYLCQKLNVKVVEFA